MYQSFLSRRSANLGLDLVSQGLATVEPFDPELEGNPAYKKYYKHILAAEEKAEKKSVGLWKEGDAKKKQDSLVKKVLKKILNK